MVDAANGLNIANNRAFNLEEAARNKAEVKTACLPPEQKELELKAIGIMRSLSPYLIDPKLRGIIYLAITTNPEACEAVAAVIRNNRNGDPETVLSEIRECLAADRKAVFDVKAEPASTLPQEDYKAQNLRNAINDPAYLTRFQLRSDKPLTEFAARIYGINAR